MRVGSAVRLVTPRAAGGYAFESTGDSEDEGTELEVDEDVLSYQNVNSIFYIYIFVLGSIILN